MRTVQILQIKSASVIPLISIFLAWTCVATAAPAPAKKTPAKKWPSTIEFEYTDGLYGSYKLTTTPTQIHLRAGPRQVRFDVKQCNQKLIDVYLGRVKNSLSQLQPALRDKPQNRLVMNKRVYRVANKSAAAPMLRNLPSETFYLSRLASDVCRGGRVPSSEGASEEVVIDAAGVLKKFDMINDELEIDAKMPGEKCATCQWRSLMSRGEIDEEVQDCVQSICRSGKSADIPSLNALAAETDKAAGNSEALAEFSKEYAPVIAEAAKKSKVALSAEDLEYAMGQCKMNYAVMTVLAPSPEKLEKIKKVEAEIRANMTGVVAAKFSADMKAKIQAMKIVYPETAQEFKKRFVAGVKSAPDLLEYCSTTVQEPQPVVTTSDEMITVEALLSENLTREVIAHQLAHGVSAELMSAKKSGDGQSKFIEVRRCLAMKHKGEGRSQLLRVGTDQVPESEFTEEDFADALARAATPKSKGNVWCSAFKENGEGDFDLYSTSESSQPTELFRLLHREHAIQGGLSKTCQKMLKTGGAEKVDFSSCL